MAAVLMNGVPLWELTGKSTGCAGPSHWTSAKVLYPGPPVAAWVTVMNAMTRSPWSQVMLAGTANPPGYRTDRFATSNASICPDAEDGIASAVVATTAAPRRRRSGSGIEATLTLGPGKSNGFLALNCDASRVSRPDLLLAVPNFSEGRHMEVLEAIERHAAPARFLDIHADPDHNRSAFTVAGRQGELAAALVSMAGAAVEHIDLSVHAGLHPHVGAIDVAPVVYRTEEQHGPALAEALTAAALLGEEVGLPVFLYGELATRPEHVERADLRRGGPAGLAERMAAGELVPDYGPPEVHPTAGAVLVAARPPLVAFNLDLDTDDVEVAKRIAARLRESGGGPPGVRAIGLYLEARGRAQVSTNVHDHHAVPLREIVERVRAEAEVAAAELIGLAPRAAFEGFPADVPLRGFDPERQLIEEALANVV